MARIKAEQHDEEQDDVVQRRVLRTRYLAVKNFINGEKEEIARPDSDSFNSVINEVQSLHEKVQKPREQVADAEALLYITNSLVTSVKAQKSEGISPSDFVSCLLRDFGAQGRASSSASSSQDLILWADIGRAVSHIFRSGAGCCTMFGPMNTELKQRKASIRKKHTRPTESAQPEELTDSREEKTDTDKNMLAMFDILRKKRRVRLENLVLNRTSFPQTVENLFALSFLVKDGRAEITVNKDGHHLVSPRNAPAAGAVASGEVSYSHFVFRFDFKDWKSMKDFVEAGAELMPPRNLTRESPIRDLPVEATSVEPEKATTTPIRKLSRNRGLVLQEQTVVEDSPEGDNDTESSQARAAIGKGKRKIRW